MSSVTIPPTLVVICGLPGAGKTTHARELEHRMPAVRFCPDEWLLALAISPGDEERRDRIEQFQWALAKRLIALGQSVLIEWGTWGRGERDRLREEGRSAGARVELHYLTAPFDVLVNRVERRATKALAIGREGMALWATWIHTWIQVPDADEMQLFDHAVTLET